jgi:hypothetical protein
VKTQPPPPPKKKKKRKEKELLLCQRKCLFGLGLCLGPLGYSYHKLFFNLREKLKDWGFGINLDTVVTIL